MKHTARTHSNADALVKKFSLHEISKCWLLVRACPSLVGSLVRLIIWCPIQTHIL